MKDADHGGVTALKDAHDTAHTAAIGLGRFELNQHLIALHRAVDLVGRNENVFLHFRRLARLPCIRPDKAVAVAMQVQPPGGQIVARAARAPKAGNCPGNVPVLTVQLGQRAAHGQAGQLLQQQTPLPPAAQAQLADQLLVSGLLSGGAGNPRQ